jgi:hypothetical protein
MPRGKNSKNGEKAVCDMRPSWYNRCMDHHQLLKFAIAGLEAEGQKIEQLLLELKSQLNETPTALRRYSATDKTSPKKRTMSAEGRAAIRAALKKRWADYHKNQSHASSPLKAAASKQKRTLSKAQLEAMRRNAAKARAARANAA